jgi:hypothetical protein
VSSPGSNRRPSKSKWHTSHTTNEYEWYRIIIFNTTIMLLYWSVCVLGDTIACRRRQSHLIDQTVDKWMPTSHARPLVTVCLNTKGWRKHRQNPSSEGGSISTLLRLHRQRCGGYQTNHGLTLCNTWSKVKFSWAHWEFNPTSEPLLLFFAVLCISHMTNDKDLNTITVGISSS